MSGFQLTQCRMFKPTWLILLCCGLVSASSFAADSDDATARGRKFLVQLFNPQLGLLPEYEGAKVFWLYHDNYLAAKILQRTHPDIAGKINAAIRAHGVTESGKIEIVFGEAKHPLPFRRYELRDVTKIGDALIRTEITLKDENPDWRNYADLLLLAALAEGDSATARKHFDDALALWDGVGFRDAATKHSGIYATYKLALALHAARHLGQSPPSIAAMRDRLFKQQSGSGGWITDYLPDGTPRGLANVETTAMCILALEP